MTGDKKGLTYADAGVDIDAGNKAVQLMRGSREEHLPTGGFGRNRGFRWFFCS